MIEDKKTHNEFELKSGVWNDLNVQSILIYLWFTLFQSARKMMMIIMIIYIRLHLLMSKPHWKYTWNIVHYVEKSHDIVSLYLAYT